MKFRFFALLLTGLLAFAPALATTYYVRVDGSDTQCDGTHNIMAAGATDSGDTGTAPDCAFQTPGHVAGGGNGGVGVPKACGDTFVFVDTNTAGPTRFFSTKNSALGVPATAYTSFTEINKGSATGCTSANRIRWTSSTGNAADVVITRYTYVTEAFSQPDAVDLPNVWQFTNGNNGATEYTGSNGSVGGTAIWPMALKQTLPAQNQTKFYPNGDESYWGFADYPSGAETCNVGPDIDTSGLPAVNVRHHTWLCGGAAGSCKDNNPGIYLGSPPVVYFHAQTNAVLANGPQAPGDPAVGNGGNPNPTTGGFRMMKGIRQYALMSETDDGYEFDHLTFEGPTRFGGDYTYVHDNVFLEGAMTRDAGSTSSLWRGGLTNYVFANNNVRGGMSASSNITREQAGWKFVDNRVHNSLANAVALQRISGTTASHGLLARNTVGPGRPWMKPGAGSGYVCATGKWNNPNGPDHAIYIGPGNNDPDYLNQSVNNIDIANNVVWTAQEGIGIFYGNHILVDGNLLWTMTEDGSDYDASGGAPDGGSTERVWWCGTGADFTIRNNVCYRPRADLDVTPCFWRLGEPSVSAQCVDATAAWPTLDYNLYLHPNATGTTDYAVREGSTIYSLAAAKTAGKEGSHSDEVATGTSGMTDATYTGLDFSLVVGAAQINNGDPTNCGHALCTGGTADGDRCATFDATDPCIVGGGTCATANDCDQGPHEYLAPTFVGSPSTPTIRSFTVDCADNDCVGIVNTEELTTLDGNGPYTLHVCYRKDSDGCINDEAEYDLATCVDLSNPVANTRNFVLLPGLDVTTNYCFVARITNAGYNTESVLASSLATASTSAPAPFVDCSVLATVQTYINNICSGVVDIDLTPSTEAVDCDVPGESITWASALDFPESCLNVVTPVAITFNGHAVRIAGDGGDPAMTIKGSLHTIQDFYLSSGTKGIVLDHVTAGPSDVTLEDIVVTAPTTSCFEIEDEAGAQGGVSGNTLDSTVCESGPTGYVIGGIDTDVASHTDADVTFLSASCVNCGLGFRFAGGGRWTMANTEVYSTNGAACTEGVYTSAPKSYLNISGNDKIGDCSWGLKATGGAHVEIDDATFFQNDVVGVYVGGAATRIVAEDTTLRDNGGTAHVTAAYGGLGVASDATAASVCFGSCTVNLDFTNAAPTGSAETSLGHNIFISNYAPGGALSDVHNLNASSIDVEDACFSLMDANPTPQIVGLVDTTPLWSTCGGPLPGGGSSYSSTGTVYLNRALIGGPEVVGQPNIVGAGTSGNTYCGALTPVQTCQAAVTNSTLSATTCASTTGTRTVICD